MSRSSEIVAVYTAGVIQGLALITLPSAGAVLTSPSGYALSSTQYGGLFVPQAVTAIAGSLLGVKVSNRLGTKRIYLLGLLANLVAMSLLGASQLVMQKHTLVYGILLLATACLGAGFGFTVPVLNTLAAAFFPKNVDHAVLGLNALLGLGAALAPVFVAVFVGLGIWWGLPVVVGGMLVGLLLAYPGETLDAGDSNPIVRNAKSGFPSRFWVFAGFAFVYGVCESINSNWASLYMTRDLGASTKMASLALAAFWSMVTAGRILFAALEKWFPERLVSRALPFVVAVAFFASACVPKNHALLGLFTFALAGVGCSALLPLAISFGQKEFFRITASVAGGLIAFYQIGFGLAAFGVGPLQTWAGLTLSAIYGGTTVIALTMAVLSFFIARKSAVPA